MSDQSRHVTDTDLLCHRCGDVLQAGRGRLYVVRIEAFADPFPPADLADEESAASPTAAELIEQMQDLSAQELMDQVYRRLTVSLCVPCFQTWIEQPVGDAGSVG